MRIVILAVLALLSAQAHAANLFKCKGADGVVVFQNVQCANVADTQARYQYERLPDDASHVASEARYVQQNQRRYAAEAAAIAASRSSRSDTRGLPARSCIRDRFSGDNCLDYMGENAEIAKRQLAEDRLARRTGRGYVAPSVNSVANANTSQPNYLGTDSRPSGQLVPIGGNRVKDKRTGERYNTIETTPGTFQAVESPAQVNERVRKALEAD